MYAVTLLHIFPPVLSSGMPGAPASPAGCRVQPRGTPALRSVSVLLSDAPSTVMLASSPRKLLKLYADFINAEVTKTTWSFLVLFEFVD